MVLLAMVAAGWAAALVVRPVPTLPRAPDTRRTLVLPPLPLLAGTGAAAASLLLVPLPIGAAVAVVAGLVTARVVRRLEPASVRRRRLQLEGSLPHVVDLVSACLSAGGSPHGAIQQVSLVVEAPMREELAVFARRLGLGTDPVDVWASMGRHPQLGPLGRALHRAAESGASVADALIRLGIELRAVRRTAAEARARAVEVKASLPLGLCLLPAFVLVGVVPMVAGSFSLTFLR